MAPSILSLLHGGKGPGMGDIKLAAALGALLGPSLGTVAMLFSTIVGGLVAVVWMSKEWGFFGHGWLGNSIQRVLSRRSGGTSAVKKDISGVAIPYGLALAVGTLLTLVVCLWTGKEHWFWSVTAAATR